MTKQAKAKKIVTPVLVVAKPAEAPKPKKQRKRRAKKQGKAKPNQGPIAYNVSKGVSSRVGQYSKISDTQTIKGSDYLDAITVTGASGTAVYRKYRLNPLVLLNSSRLSGIARLYTKYRITDLKLRFEPQSPADTGGTVWMFFDPSPSSDWNETGTELLTRAAAMKHKANCLPFQEATLNVPSAAMRNASKALLFCDPQLGEDDTDVYAGTLYTLVDNLNTGGGAFTFGRIIIEWSLVFTEPCNAPLSSDDWVYGSSIPGSSGQTKPFGYPYVVAGGSETLFNLESDGTDNIVSFPSPGSYVMDVLTSGSGGAALTTSSVITAGTGLTVNNTIIYQGDTQTQKIWRLDVTAAQTGASFKIHDSAGTHPSGYVFITVIRYNSVAALPKSVARQAAHDNLMREITKKLAFLNTLQCTTSTTATITDSNGLTDQVASTSNTSFTGTLPVLVEDPPPPRPSGVVRPAFGTPGSASAHKLI